MNYFVVARCRPLNVITLRCVWAYVKVSQIHTLLKPNTDLCLSVSQVGAELINCCSI